MAENIAPGAVYIWQVEIGQLQAQVPALLARLAPDERERARRYRFAEDRTAYVVVRGLLRLLLGRYMGIAPQDLQFRYNVYGKPGLEQGPAFNVSRTRLAALLAFGAAETIGVDIERKRPEIVTPQLARQVLSTTELAQFDASTQAADLFFDVWTRKEAYVKALGTGLSTPLPEFTVLHQEKVGAYRLYPLAVAVSDHVAALAVKGEGCTLVMRNAGLKVLSDLASGASMQ
jgi:4'-phosphopantetheinyl transferase